LVCLELLLFDLVCPLHGRADLGFHVRDCNNYEAGLVFVERLAQVFEVSSAHACCCVSGERAEQRACSGRTEEEASADGSRREQDNHQACRQPDSSAEHTADTRRGLVFLDDLDLALVVAFDDGCIVGIDQVGFGVKLFDYLIVRKSIFGIAVDACPVLLSGSSAVQSQMHER
jgi:hypothetical protein